MIKAAPTEGKFIMKKLIFLTMIFTNTHVHAISLRFIGDQVFNTGEKIQETELGGLSGLFYDQKRQTLLAISDDRSQKNPARFYEFSLAITEEKIQINAKNVVTLKNKEVKPFEKRTVDFEGITATENAIFISSEGDMNRTPQINPELFKFDRQGNYKQNLSIPEKFLLNPDKPDSRGVRNNLAFETLASSPDGIHLFLAAEEALLQDGSITTPNYSSKVRIITYENEIYKNEYAYELDKIQAEPVAGLIAGETGLVDIAPYDAKNFLALERSYLPLAKKSVIKIFRAQIDATTTDIKNFDSIKNQKVTPINKTLILNLDEIIPKLSKSHPFLDNIEGIVFGPKLSNGNATLILVSDNNFSLLQKTVFYAFEIIP